MIEVDDPYTLEVVARVQEASESETEKKLEDAHTAFKTHRFIKLEDRKSWVRAALQVLEQKKEAISFEITRQMGKPIVEAQTELKTFVHRAETLLELADEGLRSIEPKKKLGFERFITREPVGVVAVLAPWNYPFLTAAGALISSVLAGNAVIIKHSPRTPLCAERFAELFAQGGAPKNLVQSIHLSNADTAKLVQDSRIGFVAFTGSVPGGRAIYQAVAEKRFIDVGLELGGNDPAYVLEDADISFAANNLAEGALYNAGQSCCAIERVYVNQKIAPVFTEALIEAFKKVKAGDPKRNETNLGPIAQPHALHTLQELVEDARKKGTAHIVETPIHEATKNSPKKNARFFSPTLLIEPDDASQILCTESFGPLLALKSVRDDQEAISRMNNSSYGLSASLWTRDNERALRLAHELDFGTVFQNRCDYLDPELAWTGVRDSGKGVSLSVLGFHSVTRPKSYHLRNET